ncbi:MAG: hypothetical protein ACTHWZ_01675 [Peptoniphilaceae bacterium]
MTYNIENKTSKYDPVPIEIKNLSRWVGWKKGSRKDKEGNTIVTKIPFSLLDFKSNAWNQNDKWLNYKEICEKGYQNRNLGYVLTKTDNITAIDLDDCFIDGKLKTFAERIVNYFQGSYMEYSQSGQGIHIFVEGNFPQNINLQTIGIEVYGWDRYIALTGDIGDGKHFKVSNTLYSKQNELNGLWEELKGFVINTERQSLRKDLSSTVSITAQRNVPSAKEILSTMERTNERAGNLIQGNSLTGDPSRDDFTFLLLARNYTNKDANLMEEIFLMTSLNRMGTGEKRKNDMKYLEYLRNTINKVLNIPGFYPFDWTSFHKYHQRRKAYEER